jgi:peptidyl-tRNA hydrolase, PTH1 family
VETAIQLLVGLGNPGPQYSQTRHNAGAWLVETLAIKHGVPLRLEAKFSGTYAKLNLAGQTCHLLCPTTFMNQSGTAVQAFAHFYRIPVEAICIVHDDLDLAAGMVRLKQGGGHGGHNGLRDLIQALNSQVFCRLRIGIGHPGHKDKVLDYVLAKPSKPEHELIEHGLADAIDIIPLLLQGQFAQAMQQLHTQNH